MDGSSTGGARKRCGAVALVVGVGIALLCGCRATTTTANDSHNDSTVPTNTATPVAIAPNGEVITLELATDDTARERGMMGRTEAPRGSGMLFLFPTPAVHKFWMYNCLIALDIVWLDPSGLVLYVGEELPPCRSEPQFCPNYGPDTPADAVLEVAGGEAKRMGIVAGAKVMLSNIPAGIAR